MIDATPVAAVDATGLETRHVSQYFRDRCGPRRGRRSPAWPKLTVVLHVGSHLLLGAITRRGPCNDAPDFAPALRQAARLLAPQPFDTVLGDAAYDAEAHHQLCHEQLGVRDCLLALNPRNNGRRWPQTPYRRALRRRGMPHARYHQRWQVESGFSRHKRRLGAALTTRSTAAHRRELVLRVLVHNLMLLALSAQDFNRATQDLRALSALCARRSALCAGSYRP